MSSPKIGARCAFALMIAVATAWVVPAYSHEVVVPESNFFDRPVMTSKATARLDSDSVILAFAELRILPFGGRFIPYFQVVNIDTGAIELPPTQLPMLSRTVLSIAVLGPDSALILLTDEFDEGKSKYFVVSPLTGAITRGPVTHSPDADEYQVAVVDPSTVLVASRAFKGTFSVIDPQAGTVKVPATPISDIVLSSLGVVALDQDSVVIVYGGDAPDYRSFYIVVSPGTGARTADPVEIEPWSGIQSLLRLSSTEALIFYTGLDGSKFVSANTATGHLGVPTTYATGVGTPSPALLGKRAVLIPYERFGPDSPGAFVIHDVEGQVLVPETIFNPEPTGSPSAAASGCRVLLAYVDAGDPLGRHGKFQVLDFSDICPPEPCPEEITTQVEVFRSRLYPFFFTPFRFQWVLIRNRTPGPIPGPLALVMRDLDHAAYIGSRLKTTCFADAGEPFAVVHGGEDGVLGPEEAAVSLLLFWRTEPGRIDYLPTVLSGIPTR